MSTMYNNGNSGKSKTIDWSNGSVQKVILTDNTNLTFSNVPKNKNKFELICIQDAIGGRRADFLISSTSPIEFVDNSDKTIQNDPNSCSIVKIKCREEE